MRNTLYFITFLFLFLLACKQQNHISGKSITSANQVRQIVKEVKFLSLPYIFDANKPDDLIKKYYIDPNGLDSLVFPETVLTIMGCLPDTTNFYAFLVGEPGDMFYPNIITYDKTGKRISKEIISTCNCLTNPIVEIESCYDSVIIRKDFSFYSFSQLKATIQPYDSVKKIFDASTSAKLFGRIETSGKIQIKKDNK